jgi:predicted nucleic acid-binding protein
MRIERVVINASPLITLFKSQLVSLLPQLFTHIVLPQGVFNEITASQYIDDPAAKGLPQTTWIEVTPVPIADLIAAWDVGQGESEVLSFALNHPNYHAMIDDAAARRCARSLGIPTLGTCGMLILAKRRQLIPSIAEPIQALRDAGLWLSDDLVHQLKQQANEA